MERRKLLLVVVILLVSMFLFLSCGNSESGNQSKIVGKWYRIDNKDRVELFHDKTYVFENGNNGNWILLQDGRFKFTSRGGEVFFGMLDDLDAEALIIKFNNEKGEAFFKHPATAPAQNISKLIGKWKNNDGITFDFKPNGIIIITNSQGTTVKAKYVLGGRFIKIITNAQGNGNTAIIEIDNNDLTFIAIGGLPDGFRKVN